MLRAMDGGLRVLQEVVQTAVTIRCACRYDMKWCEGLWSLTAGFVRVAHYFPDRSGGSQTSAEAVFRADGSVSLGTRLRCDRCNRARDSHWWRGERIAWIRHYGLLFDRTNVVVMC